MITRRFVLAAGLFAAVLGFSQPGFAADWPDRTVKVIVPHGSGGIADVLARVTAEKLGKKFDQTFVVENRTGAGGAIGVDALLRAPRDGYTVLLGANTLFTVLPLIQKVDYKPLEDLLPLSVTGKNGMVLVVNNEAPYSTLDEFVEYARANPGAISYATGGPGVPNHLTAAYFAGTLDLDMVAVPYGGGQAALTALMAGEVQMHFGNSSDLIGPIKNGQVKALAVSSRDRIEEIPDVPSVSDTVPEFEFMNWNGYAVASDFPPEAKQKLADALAEIAKDPDVVSTLGKLGVESSGIGPDETEQLVREEMVLHAKMVDMAGVRRK